MTPSCDGTGQGLLQALAGVGADQPLDRARLASIAAADRPIELSSGYNRRRCRAIVTALTNGQKLSFDYDVTQSEGLQKWYVVELDDALPPQAAALREHIAAEYRQ